MEQRTTKSGVVVIAANENEARKDAARDHRRNYRDISIFTFPVQRFSRTTDCARRGPAVDGFRTRAENDYALSMEETGRKHRRILRRGQREVGEA